MQLTISSFRPLFPETSLTNEMSGLSKIPDISLCQNPQHFQVFHISGHPEEQRSLHLTFWWQHPRGTIRGGKNVVFIGRQCFSLTAIISY